MKKHLFRILSLLLAWLMLLAGSFMAIPEIRFYS